VLATASVYTLAVHKHKINHKHKIHLNHNGATVEVFLLISDLVCGTTADAADLKISNQPVTFESNRNCSIRIES